jgi:hypothetical protein
VIQAKGRDFVPRDREVADQFKNLTFSLTEVVRILADPDPLFIANKMICFVNFSYLSGIRGIHVTGALLGIENPWSQIAQSLQRNEEDLKKTVNDTVNRRNDIVHQADREKTLDGPQQDISGTPGPNKQSIPSVMCVCVLTNSLPLI